MSTLLRNLLTKPNAYYVTTSHSRTSRLPASMLAKKIFEHFTRAGQTSVDERIKSNRPTAVQPNPQTRPRLSHNKLRLGGPAALQQLSVTLSRAVAVEVVPVIRSAVSRRRLVNNASSDDRTRANERKKSVNQAMRIAQRYWRRPLTTTDITSRPLAKTTTLCC